MTTKAHAFIEHVDRLMRLHDVEVIGGDGERLVRFSDGSACYVRTRERPTRERYLVWMQGGTVYCQLKRVPPEQGLATIGEARRKAREYLNTYAFRYCSASLRGARLAIKYDWTRRNLVDSSGMLSVEVW